MILFQNLVTNFCSLSFWCCLFRYILQKTLWPFKNRCIYCMFLCVISVFAHRLPPFHSTEPMWPLTACYTRTNLGVSQQCGWILYLFIFFSENNFVNNYASRCTWRLILFFKSQSRLVVLTNCFNVTMKIHQIYQNLSDCRKCVLWQLTVVVDGIGDDRWQCNAVASGLIL